MDFDALPEIPPARPPSRLNADAVPWLVAGSGSSTVWPLMDADAVPCIVAETGFSTAWSAPPRLMGFDAVPGIPPVRPAARSMDVDAVPWPVAGRGSSDWHVRHPTDLAWESDHADALCCLGSSTVQRPVAAATGEAIFIPPSLGNKVLSMRGSQPEWVILDCFMRYLTGEDSSRTTLATLAYEPTSAGDLIGVGFRAAPPPETSRLIFNWIPGGSGRKKGQLSGFQQGGQNDSSNWTPDSAKAVATHRNAILLRFLLPSKGGLDEEFFVYWSDPNSLKRLGPCGHDFINCYVENNIGVICRDEDEFAVAHLTVTPKEGSGNSVLWSACPVTAELCYMLSKDGSWRTKSLPIRHGEGKAEGLIWWQTDAVISSGDSVCWVDYLRGLLFCDIFSPNPELRYVPLPVTPYKGNRHPELGDRGGIYAYRSVCVAQDGATIKFIDAGASNLWFYGSTYQSSAPSITSWTLSSDHLTWMLDGAIEVERFYDLTRCLGLPRMQPRYPLVDIKCPQIVYFALKEETRSGTTRSGTLLVPVDMVSKMIGRPTAYALRSSVSSDEGGSYTTSCNLFYNEPFLPCEFSKFLGLHVSRTRNGA